MLATVTGTYKNGQIILDEELPVKSKSAKVIVTLVEDTVENEEKPTRQFGRLKGTFTDPYWSSKEFNDPLDDLKDYM
ncbi:hypothetical protein [Spirosoma pollinicola]|uniref:DUF2281 domain-containing protein n=1 Tax=Spirosoma pollinicola TaxID=2057025 RepID=A0A2K8Z6P3_9BACT|nr:hypothetical protein [Spirosoma pollinicola]AUD05535.1 hypothetical protein CWM47_29025 [Spirosoma pollinicola]